MGEDPGIWKRSCIKPIPKSADASAPKDFRPVALTSVISKTFERLLLRYITPFLTDDHQFAYRQNRSTEDALAQLVDIASAHLDNNSKNSVRCVFIDFPSAFNTISPCILIDQLVEYGCNPNIVNILYSFLSSVNRRSALEVDLLSTYYHLQAVLKVAW